MARRRYDLGAMAASVAGVDRRGMAARTLRLVVIAVAALACVACRAPDTPVTDEELMAALEPTLVIGQTTRADALLRFGVPAERFEGDRILCWRITTDAAAPRPVSQYVSPWYATPLAKQWLFVDLDPRVRLEAPSVRSLVLVFDEGGVLRRARALQQP